MNLPEKPDPGSDPVQYLIKVMLDDIERTEKKVEALKKSRRLGYHDWWMIFVGFLLACCIAGLVWVNWWW